MLDNILRKMTANNISNFYFDKYDITTSISTYITQLLESTTHSLITLFLVLSLIMRKRNYQDWFPAINYAFIFEKLLNEVNETQFWIEGSK